MTWTTRPRSEFGGLSAVNAGSGPLVILLHGVGLRAEAWGGQIEPLAAAGYRVLCPDMSGHGNTAFTDPGGLDGYAASVAALVNEPAVLVGHSMGALIAMQIAASGNPNVRGVAALNAIFRRPASARQAVIERARALDERHKNDPSVTLQRWFADDASEERDACTRWLHEVNPVAYKAAYTVFAESDGPTDAELSRIQCPALFLTGAGEPNSTPEMSRKLAGMTQQGRAEIVADAAHMMPMTHASEVNTLLLRFLSEVLPCPR